MKLSQTGNRLKTYRVAVWCNGSTGVFETLGDKFDSFHRFFSRLTSSLWLVTYSRSIIRKCNALLMRGNFPYTRSSRVESAS